MGEFPWELNDEAVVAQGEGMCGKAAAGDSELDAKAPAKMLNDGSKSDGG